MWKYSNEFKTAWIQPNVIKLREKLSGSDYDCDGYQEEPGDIAWYWDNNGSSTHEVGNFVSFKL